MAELIRMSKMTDTMEEGVIASWLVKEGDEVESGTPVAEVETDKATMELECYEDGVILYIGPAEGDAVPVNAPIAILGEEGENIEALKAEFGKTPVAADTTAAESPAEVAAPAAAQEIDLSSVNAAAARMPLKTDTMEEGVISSWLVKVGDKVEEGDIVAEVETDKATMELECYEEGTVLYLAVEEGEGVPVNGIFMIVGEEGAAYQKLLDAEAQKGSGAAPAEVIAAPQAEAKEAVAQPASPVAETKPPVTTNHGGRIKASPLAKRMADEHGYDLSQIQGSGDGGRIIKRDVENFTPAAQTQEASSPAPSQTFASAPVGQESFREEKVSQMRKAIARRLSESKFTAPHFYLTMSIDMDKAMKARKSINEMIAPGKVSFNDMIIKSVAVALRRHPQVNSSWLGDTIRFNEHIHIGVAVAVDEGLLVPVVRHADAKSLTQIGSEVRELAGKAKNKKLQPQEWEGNTFTISNLGMFGIEEFTAIVNPPDACILAVGGIQSVPVVKNGEVVPGNVMKVTLSCDHRVVDGAVGAAFLQTLKQLLEDPVRMIL